MNLKKIIIYQNEALLNILSEIKDEFNLDLLKADKKNILEIKKELKNNFLLIASEEIKNIKNLLILDKLPIKIEKLIEQINLKFLKERFNEQSDVSIGDYKININSREISKDNKSIYLTEREINLIMFLKNSSLPAKIEELQKKVWDYGSELETHTVETHIYRLRKKIKEKFKDDNFIVSSKRGYLIK
tara:strand:- start:1162 stop:1725 length:564 start_codon:yes stop_codon:yes gene_type:complete